MRRALLCVFLATAACGGPRLPTRTVATSATRAPPSTEGWQTASWEDRHDTMTFVVLPNMARLFQQHEGKPSPDLTCRSCHGHDAEAVQYKMPHGLPALDPAHMPDPTTGDRRGRMAKFMIEEVTPMMIDLLEVAPYDARTKQGFGCFSCHPVGR